MIIGRARHRGGVGREVAQCHAILLDVDVDDVRGGGVLGRKAGGRRDDEGRRISEQEEEGEEGADADHGRPSNNNYLGTWRR